MIITPSYFTQGELLIEGLADSSTITGQAMTGEVERYIRRYERQYIKELLGRSLAERFLAWVETRPADVETDNEGFERLYRELSSFNGDELRSPIANFVYFHLVRRNQTRATQLGVTVANSDNRVVSATHLLCHAWNEMVEMNRELCHLVHEIGGEMHYELCETINSIGL